MSNRLLQVFFLVVGENCKKKSVNTKVNYIYTIQGGEDVDPAEAFKEQVSNTDIVDFFLNI